MTDEALIAKGWRCLRKACYRKCGLWDHPGHQYASRGFFTKSLAVEHQRKLDRGWQCDCVPAKEER